MIIFYFKKLTLSAVGVLKSATGSALSVCCSKDPTKTPPPAGDVVGGSKKHTHRPRAGSFYYHDAY
jgi:hypothetical protein